MRKELTKGAEPDSNDFLYGVSNCLDSAKVGSIKHYPYGAIMEGLGDVMPSDIYTGRHLGVILEKREWEFPGALCA